MPCIDLSNSAGKHDGLYPLPPLTVRESQPKRACKALYQRLTKLVAVIRGPVARLYLYLKGSGKVGGINKRLILPRQGVTRDIQVTHTVRGSPCHNKTAPARGMAIPYPPPCTCLCPGKWGNTCGKVVCLCCKDDVIVQPLRTIGGRMSRIPGYKTPNLISRYSA